MDLRGCFIVVYEIEFTSINKLFWAGQKFH